MSENPEDKPGSVERLTNTQLKAPQLGRRLFIFRAAAVLGATLALGTSRKALAHGKMHKTYGDPGFYHHDTVKGGGTDYVPPEHEHHHHHKS